MPETCIAKTKAGERCGAIAVRDSLCTLHANPAWAAEMGRKSGLSRRAGAPGTRVDEEYELQPPRTAQEVCSALGKIISDLRGRRVDSKTASTLAYASSVLLKALEVSRLEERLTIVEVAVEKLFFSPRSREIVPDSVTRNVSEIENVVYRAF